MSRGLRIAFWLTATVVAGVLVGGKLMMHASAQTADLDTGNYSNFAWGLVNGQGFYGSVLGRHHLGEHFSPIMLLVAPMYLVRATAYNLMILQGLAVAAGVMLTVAFAAREIDRVARAAGPEVPTRQVAGLKVTAVALLLVLMNLYPPLLATWNAQFQPIELGLPLVIAAMMLLHAPATRGNLAWLWLVVLLLLMTRESAPLSVLGLAIYAAGLLKRWRLALVLAAVAGLWFAVTMGLVMPYFRAGARWGHVRWIGWGEMWDLKSFYLAAMIGGMGFLPLLGRRALWATAGAAPGILLNLAVAREPQITFRGHYDAQTGPFLLVASAHGLAWLAGLLVLPALARRSQRAGTPDSASPPASDSPIRLTSRPGSLTLAAAVAAVAIASAGIFAGQAHMRFVPKRLLDDWYPTAAHRRLINQSKELARKYAAAPSMAAHGTIGPHVCHRREYRSMRVADQERWPGWVRDRVDPGMVFLVPGERYVARDGARQILRESGRAILIERTPWVEAYRWPEDAPPRGTREAEEYARSGLSGAGR